MLSIQKDGNIILFLNPRVVSYNASTLFFNPLLKNMYFLISHEQSPAHEEFTLIQKNLSRHNSILNWRTRDWFAADKRSKSSNLLS